MGHDFYAMSKKPCPIFVGSHYVQMDKALWTHSIISTAIVVSNIASLLVIMKHTVSGILNQKFIRTFKSWIFIARNTKKPFF